MAINDSENMLKIGIGVMVLKDNKVLMGLRKGSHGSGEYGFPGGHLEYMESFEDCAKREVFEECGIKVRNIQFQLLANELRYLPKHYVHISFLANWDSGDPVVKEPDKFVSWDWYSMDNLPEPLFKPCLTSIDSVNSGNNYYGNIQ